MAPVEIKLKKLPDDEDRPEVRHAREIDRLKQQCDVCKLWRPTTPTKDCAVREKLVTKDSKVAWDKKHLFLHSNGHCKMFQPKEMRKL